ncbi:MAG: sensor domain-containing diguanylate cyclase [Spirochaetota bacterium]
MAITSDTAFIRLLNDLTEAMLDTSDLGSMLQSLADRMSGVIGADGCYITSWDAERGTTTPIAAYGPQRSISRKFALVPGERTLTQAIAEAGHTLVVEDALNTDYISPRIAAAFPARSLLGLPLLSNGEVLGAIIISFDTYHHFTKQEIARCEHAARHVSFAVATMRLLEAEKQRSEELLALNHIGMAINSGLDFNQVVLTILEQCRGIIELDTFYLALYDEEHNQLSFPLFCDNGAIRPFDSKALGYHPGLSDHVIKTRGSLYLPDTLAPDLDTSLGIVRTGGSPSRSYIGLPLLYRDKVLGVMSVQSLLPNAYDSRQIRLLETIAAQSAIAIENARLYDELRRLSVTDGLTGAFNYRSLMELGIMEFAKAQRLDRPLSLLFFDIDHFRDFNNLHGHATGNDVLVAVVGKVRSCIRGIDLFARYGGEEFVIILPESPQSEALPVAERVRNSVEGLRIPISSHTEGLSVTISLGLASMQPHHTRFQDLLEAANTAERIAKQNGRNRVELAE